MRAFFICHERIQRSNHYDSVSLFDSLRCTYMDLTVEETKEIRAAVKYYMQRHISIQNPRYNEYEVILQKLSKSIKENK